MRAKDFYGAQGARERERGGGNGYGAYEIGIFLAERVSDSFICRRQTIAVEIGAQNTHTHSDTYTYECAY